MIGDWTATNLSDQDIMDAVMKEAPFLHILLTINFMEQGEFLKLVRDHLLHSGQERDLRLDQVMAQAKALGALEGQLKASESQVSFLEQVIVRAAAENVTEDTRKLLAEVAENIVVAETEAQLEDGKNYRPLRTYFQHEDQTELAKKIAEAVWNQRIDSGEDAKAAEQMQQIMHMQQDGMVSRAQVLKEVGMAAPPPVTIPYADPDPGPNLPGSMAHAYAEMAKVPQTVKPGDFMKIFGLLPEEKE